MSENTDLKEENDSKETPETAADTHATDPKKTEEKKETPKNLEVDDSDDTHGRYNFYPIEPLDFKSTPLRNQELHRFCNILRSPFMNVPMLVVERQEDVLPLLSLYIHTHSKNNKNAAFFSVTPSDFGLDFVDSDFSYDLRKNLNLGGTIIEDGDLNTKIPVYCDLGDYDDREVLGTFVGNFLKASMPAVLVVRQRELEGIRFCIEQDKLISGGLENPASPYHPKGLARASELKIAPLTPEEKQIYFTHHLTRMAFDNDIQCDPAVMKFFVGLAIKRFSHNDVFFKVFELMNQAIVAAKESKQKSLSKKIVAKVFKRMAPVHDRTRGLANLDTRLKKKIFGQDEAINTCYESILSNLDDENRDKPTVLAFFGPSGVGKTALAEEISYALTGQKASIINMAEYADSFKASILTGSSKGYVDSDKDGLLAQIVKSNANAVIVLDEFEKAHQQVQQTFLGIFDKGSVFDNHAGQIDMSKTTIILTSNAGVRSDRGIGFGSSGEANYIADKELIQKEFPPELLGRIDAKILFHPLSNEALGRIVDKFMNLLKPRFNKLGIRVVLTPQAKQELVDKAKDPASGARPLLSYIRQKIKTPIEIDALKKRIKRGSTIIIENVENRKMRVVHHTKPSRHKFYDQHIRQS